MGWRLKYKCYGGQIGKVNERNSLGVRYWHTLYTENRYILHTPKEMHSAIELWGIYFIHIFQPLI